MAKSLPAYFAALLVAAASCGSEVALPSAIPDASPTAKTATAQPVAAPTGAQTSTNAAESMRNVVLPGSMVSPEPMTVCLLNISDSRSIVLRVMT